MAVELEKQVGGSAYTYSYHRIARIDRLTLTRDGGFGELRMEGYRSAEARASGEGPVARGNVARVQLSASEVNAIQDVLYQALARADDGWSLATPIDPEPVEIQQEDV